MSPDLRVFADDHIIQRRSHVVAEVSWLWPNVRPHSGHLQDCMHGTPQFAFMLVLRRVARAPNKADPLSHKLSTQTEAYM